METVHGLLERNAIKYPEKDAFITKTTRMTFREMNEKANQIARYLEASGIKKGYRVAILSRNNERFFYSFFSLLKLGAIPMPLNVKLTHGEIGLVLKNVEADGILYEEEFKTTTDKISDTETSIKAYNIHQIVEESSSMDNSNLNLPINSTDICEILFTSGTTGVPKGVLFSHKNVLSLTHSISTEFSFTNEDKALTVMPLSHSAPLNNFTLGPMYVGASVVLDDFTPESFLEWIHEEKTTFTFAAPVAFLLVSKEKNIKQYDLSSMRVFAYGGSSMPLATYDLVTSVFDNKNFYQVYGLTESGPNGSMLRPHEHLTKSGSIGKDAVINLEMKIINENGIETASGEYGEILLRGETLMQGYYNNSKATAETIKDDWLYTGDIAYKDEDGYVFIVDRKKDVIIPGGVNVYPREVEEVLTKHPAIYQACVVGVPDEQWGETVKAVVVLNENVSLSENELREYVAEHLADYKHPRIYSFVKELPHSASGKILKHKVKEL